MCRMLGFISTEKISAETFYKFALKMAKEGKKAPHKDGFGVCAIDGKKTMVYKEINPLWERKRDFRNIVGNVGIIHARKASWMKSNILCTHPFVKGFNCFAHNGKIFDFEGKCDSWEFFSLILKNGLNAINSIKNASSLTYLLAKENKLTALRCAFKSESYYTLYEGKIDNAIVISSEEFDGSREIENFTMVEYEIKYGKIVRREEKVCFQSQ